MGTFTRPLVKLTLIQEFKDGLFIRYGSGVHRSRCNPKDADRGSTRQGGFAGRLAGDVRTGGVNQCVVYYAKCSVFSSILLVK